MSEENPIVPPVVEPAATDDEEIEIDEIEETPEPAKPVETPEQKSARLARMQDQHDKKHGLGKYKTEEVPSNKKSEDFDYGQKAFLIANDVKTPGEMELAKNIMKASGMDLEAVLNSGYFQSELKNFREAQATKNAIPQPGKRNGQIASDQVEYWLAKDELPPASQVELRRKVVNAKIKAKSDGSPFTNNPVVQ